MPRLPFLLCLIGFLPLGCAGQRAEMFAAAGGQVKPDAAAAPEGGIARYASRGTEAALKARRDDAHRLMRAACSGPYKIVTEGPYRVLDVGTTVIPAGEGGFTVQNTEEGYWMIVFSCDRAPRALQDKPSR